MQSTKCVERYKNVLSYRIILITLILACMMISAANNGYTFSYANGIMSIPLEAGWNMISFPGTLADSSPDSLVKDGSMIILPMYRWNPLSYSYVEVTEIKQDEGYWILAIADDTLTAEITLSSSYTINLKAGWNMIGSVYGNVDFSNPQDTLDDSIILPIYSYDPAVFGYYNSTIIETGKGYWVLAIRDCSLTIAGESVATLKSLSILPYDPRINLGQSQQFSAIGVMSDDVVVDFTNQVTWTSSNETVADINVNGLAPSLKVGTTQIGASINTLSAVLRTLTVVQDIPPVEEAKSGWMDGIVYDSRSGLPLEDVRISVKNVDGIVYSDADGKYFYPSPGSGTYNMMIEKPGYTYAQRVVTTIAGEDVAVETAYLTPIDQKFTLVVPDNKNDQVATNANGSIEMTFPAGSVSSAIEANATLYEKGAELPGALPETSFFTYAMDFQPDGATFAKPVKIRFLNDRGFAPGTQIPVGYYNKSKAQWEHECMGTVSYDGEWVEYEVTHFSPFDCNDPVTPYAENAKPDSVNNQESQENPCEPASGGNSLVGLKSGALSIDHELPKVQSLGTASEVGLTYYSPTAYTKKLIGISSSLPEGAEVPKTARFSLSLQGMKRELSFEPTMGNHEFRALVDPINGRGERLGTGVYSYVARIDNEYDAMYWWADYFGGPPIRSTGIPVEEPFYLKSYTSGKLIIHDRTDSPMGSGWGIQNLQRLNIQTSGRLLLTSGDGSSLIYIPISKLGNDIVTANYDSNDVSLLLGNGDGTFQDQKRFSVVSDLSYIAVGDFNADGKQDLATTNNIGYVSVLLGNGDGTFQDRKRFNLVIGPPYSMVVGDFNADGKQDLAFPCVGIFTSFVLVFLGNGDGTFQSRKLFFIEDFPCSIVVGDFNADGKQDLATAVRFASQGIASGSVLLGNGDGTFQDQKRFSVEEPSIMGFNLESIAVGDFNGDDKQDLVIAGESFQFSVSRFLVLLGNGDGTFQYDGLERSVRGAQSIAVGDFNTDGIQDLAVASKVDDHVSVLLGNGDGTFQSQIWSAVGDVPYSIAVGDFNGDGNQDLTTANSLDNNVSVLLGNGDGTFQYQKVFAVGSSPRSIAVGDFNGDVIQSSDKFLYRSSSGDYSILQRNDDGTYTRTMKDGTKYNFDSNGLQTSTVDRNGNTTTYTYGDANGDGKAEELMSITDPVGQVTTFTYNNQGITKIIDPIGRETKFTIDAQGNLVEITDPDGSKTSFTYDERHLMTSQTKKNGQTTQYIYDKYGKVKETIAPEQTFWDGNSLVVKKEQRGYNLQDVQGLINDLPSGVGTPSNPAPVVRPEQIGYSMTDGKGVVSTTGKTYSCCGTIQKSDALGRTTFTKHNADHLPIQITRPNGSIVTMTYDIKGNLLTSTEESISATTKFTYDPVFNQITSITDPKGKITKIEYDSHGNLIKTIDALSNTSIMTYNNRGLLTSIKDLLNGITTYAYDDKGKLTSITDALLRTSYYAYDPAGNVTSITDPAGKKTFFDYDVMNRLITVTEPSGAQTWYDYDASGNLVKVTDAKNQVTEFQYDALNQLSKMIDPLRKEEQYYYDLNRNLARINNRNGNTFTLEYDAANQLVKKLMPDDQVTYAYGLLGELSSAVDSDSGLQMVYDTIGRLTKISTLAMSQPATDISYTYDLNSNRTQMVLQGGVTKYAYDDLNRLVSITNPSNKVVNYTYDGLNRRKTMSLPNGTATTYNYDAVSQLTNITHKAGLNVLSSYTYGYDLAGNRNSMTEPDGVNNYSYDLVDQLVNATHPQPTNPTETFTYDLVGNRTSSATSSNYTYGLANRLNEDDQYTYGYDLNGNMIQKTEKSTGKVTKYIFNSENKLVRIDFSDGKFAIYRYDAFGRRIQKNVNGTITSYLYDNEDILQEYDGSNQVIARYTHGPGIDESAIMNTGGQDYFYHADGLGSITAITDASGNIAQTYTYDAFGNVVNKSGGVPNHYTYASRELDQESGLYYYRARYYDSNLGRFISEDPIGFFGGDVNLYRYVSNKPINFADPHGLQEEYVQNFANAAIDFKNTVLKFPLTVLSLGEGGTIVSMITDYAVNGTNIKKLALDATKIFIKYFGSSTVKSLGGNEMMCEGVEIGYKYGNAVYKLKMLLKSALW